MDLIDRSPSVAGSLVRPSGLLAAAPQGATPSRSWRPFGVNLPHAADAPAHRRRHGRFVVDAGLCACHTLPAPPQGPTLLRPA